MTLSFVTAISSSSTSTPTPMAYSNAGRVFSGRMARAPRWPWTRIFGSAESIAVEKRTKSARSASHQSWVRRNIALAAIAAAQAFLAAMIIASIFGAVDANLVDGSPQMLQVNVAVSSFIWVLLGWQRFRGLAVQNPAAALRFLIDDLEFLFLGGRQIGDVLAQIVAIRGIFNQHADQQIADGRILIIANTVDQRIQPRLQSLQPEIGIERERQPSGCFLRALAESTRYLSSSSAPFHC